MSSARPFVWGAVAGGLATALVLMRSAGGPEAAESPRRPPPSVERAEPDRVPAAMLPPAGTRPESSFDESRRSGSTASTVTLVGDGSRLSGETRNTNVQVSRRAPSMQTTAYRGSLSVSSRPQGADVFINGRRMGKTPLLLNDVSVGSRALRLTLDGYEPWSNAPRVVAGEQTRVTADLRRMPLSPQLTSTGSTGFRGSLLVDSRPGGAAVFLNGQRAGTTPLFLEDLAVGSRAVRLTLAGHEAWSNAVRVVAGEQTRVTVDLRRIPERE